MLEELVSKYKSPISKAEPSGSCVGAEPDAPKYVFAKLFTEARFVATVLTEAIEPPTLLMLVFAPATVFMLVALALTAVIADAELFTVVI